MLDGLFDPSSTKKTERSAALVPAYDKVERSCLLLLLVSPTAPVAFTSFSSGFATVFRPSQQVLRLRKCVTGRVKSQARAASYPRKILVGPGTGEEEGGARKQLILRENADDLMMNDEEEVIIICR